MVEESQEPGASVSLVARPHGVNLNRILTRRRLAADGALTAAAAGRAFSISTAISRRSRV